MTSPEVRPFALEDAATGFRSGVRALDDFLARHAAVNDALGVCRTYVMPGDDPPVLGFYTLSMADVESAEVAPALGARLPRYPMPVALVGRLAVDERARGRRIGEALLVDALRRTLEVSAVVGCVGVIVDAKDGGAAAFYARYGFAALTAGAWPQRMFLPLATIRESFEG